MFQLKKPLGKHKTGKVFDSFGGLVSGVDGVRFDNTEYFKYIKQ